MLALTLIYFDQTRFIVGAFDSVETARAWADEEKTRPYWDESTEFELVNTQTSEIVPLYEAEET